jgi:hypothetical protein
MTVADPDAEFEARLAQMRRDELRRFALACMLEKLLRGCESSPAAVVTRLFMATPKARCPRGLSSS